mmetsp:Transcript_13914/g.21137  ORF Transcript_13914/g.21137 Transcript_13914/m.21137 type:complete len:208 (-) Transcript_13914:8-631(-)
MRLLEVALDAADEEELFGPGGGCLRRTRRTSPKAPRPMTASDSKSAGVTFLRDSLDTCVSSYSRCSRSTFFLSSGNPIIFFSSCIFRSCFASCSCRIPLYRILSNSLARLARSSISLSANATSSSFLWWCRPLLLFILFVELVLLLVLLLVAIAVFVLLLLVLLLFLLDVTAADDDDDDNDAADDDDVLQLSESVEVQVLSLICCGR